jgi:hypothetical protein
MANKRLLDAIERGFDIGRWVCVFAFPITDRSRVTSRCTGKFGLCQPSQHAARPNLPSRNNVTHGQTYISIPHTPPLARRRNLEKGRRADKSRSASARARPAAQHEQA